MSYIARVSRPCVINNISVSTSSLHTRPYFQFTRECFATTFSSGHVSMEIWWIFISFLRLFLCARILYNKKEIRLTPGNVWKQRLNEIKHFRAIEGVTTEQLSATKRQNNKIDSDLVASIVILQREVGLKTFESDSLKLTIFFIVL